MSMVSSAAEAVARVAYRSSNVVISVQPSLKDESEFSRHFKNLQQATVSSFLSGQPEIQTLRQNVDPFLSVFEPIRAGKLVSVTTASSALLPAIPHLSKLANYPVVIHVSLYPLGQPDYSDITAIRSSGFTFLNSETLQEAQDIALVAHSLAIKSGKGVVHFFDTQNTNKDDPIEAEKYSVAKMFIGEKRNGPEIVDTSSLYVDDAHRAVTSRPELPVRSGQTASDASETSSSPRVGKDSSRGTSTVGSSARDSSTDSHPTVSSISTAEPVVQRSVLSEDVVNILSEIWNMFEDVTGRAYKPFEYTGPENAEHAIFIFGSTGIFVDEMSSPNASPELQKVGLITARLYEPWFGSLFIGSIPKSIKRIAVLEQIKKKTTKWGPCLLNVLTSLHGGDQRSGSMMVIGHQLGHLEASTVRQALRGVVQNLQSPTPIQNLEVGGEVKPVASTPEGKPEVENAYTKVLDQVFGTRLYVANQLGSSNAGISAEIAASPEFGFGSLLARIDRKKRFVTEVETAVKDGSFITDAPSIRTYQPSRLIEEE